MVPGEEAGIVSETLEVRVARLEQAMTDLPKLLDAWAGRISDRLDGIDRRLDRIDQRLDGIDRRLDCVEQNQRQDFRLLLRMIIGAYGAGIIAFCAVFWMLAKIKGWIA
jgi:tetrahydromethanopterin S-methyltransferase subunit G